MKRNEKELKFIQCIKKIKNSSLLFNRISQSLGPFVEGPVFSQVGQDFQGSFPVLSPGFGLPLVKEMFVDNVQALWTTVLQDFAALGGEQAGHQLIAVVEFKHSD